MSIMTRKDEEVLDKLLQLANGNPLLVEQALRECSRVDPEPRLDIVVRYIKRHIARTGRTSRCSA